MVSAKYEHMLREVSARGEMPAQELARMVIRVRNDYTDFYGLAALLHRGFISTDSKFESDGEVRRGTLGLDMQATAISLNQLVLPPGESFTFNGCLRASWHDFPVSAFITAEGLFQIEALDQIAESKSQKRFDYLFAVFIAVLAAVTSGFATSYFAPQSSCPQELNNTVQK